MLHEANDQKNSYVFVDFDHEDVAYLAHKQVNDLRICRSKVRELPKICFLPKRHVFIQSCRFTNLGNLDVESIELDACNKIKVLPKSEKLMSLQLRACTSIHSLDFLEHVPNLECLSFSGRNNLSDLEGLIHGSRLRLFWSSCSNRMIKPLAERFPDLVISNTSWTYFKHQVSREPDQAYEVLYHYR